MPIEQYYLHLPGWLRRTFVEPIAQHISPMMAWKLSRAEHFDTNRGTYIHAHSTLFPDPIRKLMGCNLRIPMNIQSETFNHYHMNSISDYQSLTLATELTTYLPEDLLLLLDRTTMAVGVEGRVPFLDHRLVEAALSVPDSIRTPNGRQKHLERSMAKEFLPDSILSSPKQGFASPVPHWLRHGLADPARRILTDKKTLERGWWSKQGIENLLSNPNIHGFRIYSLVMLELAVRLYVESPLTLSAPDVTLEEFT